MGGWEVAREPWMQVRGEARRARRENGREKKNREQGEAMETVEAGAGVVAPTSFSLRAILPFQSPGLLPCLTRT